MANRDTEVNNLIINELTKAEFDISTKSENELWFVTDEQVQISEVEGLTDVLGTKQDIITDLEIIRDGASNGAIAYTTIQGYGDIVTHNAIEFALKSEIPDVSKYALDSGVVHKAGVENIPGVKTFTGGSGGNNVAIKAPNGIAIGGTTLTAYSQYATIRLVNDKVNTGSYYIDGNGSVLFRHKTGTKTAEGSANDVMFTMNPVTGFKAGFSGTAGTGITDSDLHDVLIDTIEYSKLTTTAKDVLGAINELNAKPSAPDLDNVTISKNASEELQAIAVIDNNNNAIKTWTGTLQEYNAITVKDSNTLYNITDDSTLSTSLLEIIYPIGSIYLTFNTSCPLALFFGTWELVGQDKVLQGAGTRGTVGSELPQSLPNVKGDLGINIFYQNPTGPFYIEQSGGSSAYRDDTSWTSKFDLSRSSSIYQDGANVQPDAILVNIYRRVA